MSVLGGSWKELSSQWMDLGFIAVLPSGVGLCGRPAATLPGFKRSS